MPMMALSFLHWILAAICTVFMPIVAFQLFDAGLVVSGIIYGLITLAFWHFMAGSVVAIPVLWYSAYLLARNKHLPAQRMLKRVISLWHRVPLARDMLFLTLESNLALSYLACGDYHKAEAVYDDINSCLENNKRFRKNVLAGVYYNNIACLHLHNRDFEAAELFAGKALAIWEGAKPSERAGCAYPLANMLEIYLERGEIEKCRDTADKVLALASQDKQPNQIVPESKIGVYVQGLIYKGIVALREGRLDEAKAVCAQILQSSDIGMMRFNYSLPGLSRLARELIAVGERERAEELLDIGYEILREHPFHGDGNELLAVYEKLLLETGRADEVADLKNWVRPGRQHLLKMAL